MLREIGVLDQFLATATPAYERVRIQFGGAEIDGTVPMADGETDCWLNFFPGAAKNYWIGS